MQLNLILINMKFDSWELGEINNRIQYCSWLSGGQVLSSGEIDIVGWRVSDPS